MFAAVQAFRGFRGFIQGVSGCIVPLKSIEYGFGYMIIRSPYTPYSIYFRGTIGVCHGGLIRFSGLEWFGLEGFGRPSEPSCQHPTNPKP